MTQKTDFEDIKAEILNRAKAAKACDNATVEACDNAYCTSHCIIECKLSNNAIYRVKSTNTVYYSSDNINFIKQ